MSLSQTNPAPLAPPPNFEASTPDPQTVTLVMGVLRHLLTIAGAVGFYHGTVSDSILQIVAGSVVSIGMICWSIWQKYRAAQADHAGSVRSAQIASPVKAV